MRFNKKPQQTLLDVMKCSRRTKSNTAYYVYCSPACTDLASLAAPVLGFCSWYKIWGWDRNVSPTEGPSANLPEHVKIMSSVVALTPSLKESFFSLRPSPVPAGMCAASELRNRIFTCRIFVLSDPVRGSGQVTALISVIRDATKILLLTILTSLLASH